jgi:hypothetical protein
MRCQWQCMHHACGINDTTCTTHAVSMILHELCMWCQWHCMHRSYGVIDTACILNFFCIPSLFCIWFSLFEVVKKFVCACGVNDDTTCTMHAVSMTPHVHVHAVSMTTHAPCMRSINDTACTMHAVSMTPHASCTRCQWHCKQLENSNIFVNSNLYLKRL